MTAVNPSDPITQAEVEAEIVRLNNLLDKATTETARRVRERAKAKVAYKQAHAKAYLRAGQDREEGTKPPPVAEREAMAIRATAKEELEFETADALVEAAKEAGRNMREQTASLRSINANVRGLVT